VTTAAIWLRVSTDSQTTDNQVADTAALIAQRGWQTGPQYVLADSAYKGGAQYQATLKQALADAHSGLYDTLVIWSLDRLTRAGAEDALRLIRRFREKGVTIVSVKEDWLDGNPAITDVLVAFAGWMAQQESARKSERVKAALAKRKAAGLPVGRQPGAKDLAPRKRSGYVAAWEPGGKRRKVA
jgi:putative DNA-invertase from lambdoid prophage Rac